MPRTRVDAASRLVWSLRRYAPVLGLLVVLVTGALAAPVLALANRAPIYEARSLVVATQLELDPEQLPRLAEAIFTSGDVARRTVARADLPFTARELIPEHARLEPFENNVIVRVVGRSTSPELAATISNAAAEALSAELDRLGPGIGTFEIQSRAAVPAVPVDRLPVEVLLAAAFVGALLLAVAVVIGVVVVRKPLLASGELDDMTDVPVLTGPRLPRSGHDVEPVGVLGLSVLVKTLYPDHQGIGVFLGIRGGDRVRSQLAILVARALGRRGPVSFVPLGGSPTEEALAEEPNVVVSQKLVTTSISEYWPMVVDGPTAAAFDTVASLPAEARTILVVREGAGRDAVETALSQFLPGELSYVVFIRRESRAERRARRRAQQQQRGQRRGRSEDDGPPRPADAVTGDHA